MSRSLVLKCLANVSLATLFAMPNCVAEDRVAEDRVAEGRVAEGGPLTHSFIGVGKASKIVMIGDDGKVEWKLDKPASDVWVLPNGNLLLALYPTKGYPKGGVVEMEQESKKVVFEYKGRQKEISTVVVLENGNYLIAELGATPRAVEVAKDGTVVSEMPFQCQKANVHMQVRMLRVLPNGNYIAPHLLDFAVNEYDPKSGKVLKSFATDERGQDKRDWPFTAIRLDNGNTVIGCTNGNRVIEVDESGKIVWEISNDDLPEPIISDACGVQRLPNGNTVIASYRAKGNKPKLIEVTREKKVVWTYSGMKSGFHHFQILTTNGKPLAGNTLK